MLSGKIVNMLDAGIVDPASASRLALEKCSICYNVVFINSMCCCSRTCWILMIIVYTDGSCIKGNRGGYSAVITEDNKIITTLYQGFSNTTNNRQEIRGVLAALEYFKEANKNDNCFWFTICC